MAIENQLKRFLSRYPDIKLALLFGSHVSGKPRFDSDIDLALLMDKPIGADFSLDFVKALGEEFGRPIDVVDLYYGAEPVLGQALKGKRLLGSNAIYADLLTKHLFNTADFLPIQQRVLRERREAWIG